MKWLTRKKLLYIFAGIFLLILITSGEPNTTPLQTDGSEKDVAEKTDETAPAVIDTNEPVAPRGARLLGIALSEGSVGYTETFAKGQAAGLNVIEFALSWNDVEYKKEQYKDEYLTVANGFFPQSNIQVSLGLNPIDTNNIRLPDDLAGKSFDDPEVIERFKKYVDFVSTKISNINVVTVSIGNEIDSTLNGDVAKWEEYSRFYNAVTPHVKQKFPGAVVSSKVTFNGLGDHKKLVTQYVNGTDALFLTYYPFKKGTFIVREPESVASDLNDVLAQFKEKKLYLAEVGYPAGKLNESSEDLQALFVHEVFQFWDTQAVRVPYVNFVWMHDISPKEVAQYGDYYGVTDKGFVSFLSTLGLQSYDGKPRKAYNVLKDETSKRGW